MSWWRAAMQAARWFSRWFEALQASTEACDGSRQTQTERTTMTKTKCFLVSPLAFRKERSHGALSLGRRRVLRPLGAGSRRLLRHSCQRPLHRRRCSSAGRSRFPPRLLLCSSSGDRARLRLGKQRGHAARASLRLARRGQAALRPLHLGALVQPRADRVPRQRRPRLRPRHLAQHRHRRRPALLTAAERASGPPKPRAEARAN